ncbi:kinase [Auriculariales sp. MPI-PUGE-AT-0066]|nr:kinase [Auriculariales sp. MPI-PUGE-AT-0066]
MDLTEGGNSAMRPGPTVSSINVLSSAPVAVTATKYSSYHDILAEKITDQNIALRANQEPRIDVKAEDLSEISDIGQGNSGSVKKVEHVPSGRIMAKKAVLIDATPSARKQILRALQILYTCNSPHIVSFYSAFAQDANICICTEFMDKGSLDTIYKMTGAIDVDVVAKIALAVLEGMTYLYEVHHIIHRDIKPSHILINSQGQIKVCDLGTSGELIKSVADTFIGTGVYMSPERIQGSQYTVKADVWSLGVTLVELALGRFPFSDVDTGGTTSILDLLQHIVNGPAPRLTPEGRFPKEVHDFVDACLIKDPDLRLAPTDLTKLAWMNEARVKDVDLEGWVRTK